MRAVAGGLIGANNVRHGVRTMAAEDMAYFLASVPGCFAFVGSAPKGGARPPHHSPTFDIDEESLVGAELLTQTRSGTWVRSVSSNQLASNPPRTQVCAHQPGSWSAWGDGWRCARAPGEEADPPRHRRRLVHWCHVMDGESYEIPRSPSC